MAYTEQCLRVAFRIWQAGDQLLKGGPYILKSFLGDALSKLSVQEMDDILVDIEVSQVLSSIHNIKDAFKQEAPWFDSPMHRLQRKSNIQVCPQQLLARCFSYCTCPCPSLQIQPDVYRERGIYVQEIISLRANTGSASQMLDIVRFSFMGTLPDSNKSGWLAASKDGGREVPLRVRISLPSAYHQGRFFWKVAMAGEVRLRCGSIFGCWS